MILVIESRINVDGKWWDIATHQEIADSFTPEQKVERIQAIIRGIARTGVVITRVGPSKPVLTGQSNPPPAKDAANGRPPGFDWPPPYCDIHNEPMKLSKVQGKDNVSSFYCTKRIGEEYCKKRAALDNSTGFPKFYEVK